MRVVVAGCGRVGTDVAKRFAEEGHDVSVIDDRPDALERLGSTFNGTTHLGPAIDIRILKAAGIESADAFLAVTNSDNVNLMAVQLAKQVFDVPKTLARLDEPARASAYDALGIEYIPSAMLAADVFFEHIVTAGFDLHVTFSEGNVDIVDLRLSEAAEGSTVAALQRRDRLRVAAIKRGSKVHIPSEDFVLHAGDLVVAAVRQGVDSDIRELIESGDDE